MALTLYKKAEDASTITLGWTKVPGATGYRFSAQLQASPSHSWNPDREQVIFTKGSSWYKVEALGVLEFDTYPDSPPPPPPDPQPNPPAKVFQRLSDNTRVFNMTQLQYPGQMAQEWDSTGKPWPNGGGIFEVRGMIVDGVSMNGFKLVLTPEMVYPQVLDSRLVRTVWGDPFNPYGDRWLTGKVVLMKWTDIFPAGQNFENDHTAPAIWEFPVGPSVGHNFTRQGDGRYRFQRQNAAGKSWAVYTGPLVEWGGAMHNEFQCNWTLDGSGLIKFKTNGQQWVSYTGSTIMSSSEHPWVHYNHMRAALDPSRINTRFFLGCEFYVLEPTAALVTLSRKEKEEAAEWNPPEGQEVVDEAYPGWKDNSENERKEKLPKPPKT